MGLSGRRELGFRLGSTELVFGRGELGGVTLTPKGRRYVLIVLAGPAVSLLAALLAGYLFLTLGDAAWFTRLTLVLFCALNLQFGIYNLLPLDERFDGFQVIEYLRE